MKDIKWFVPLMILIAAVVLLAGCGGDSGGSSVAKLMKGDGTTVAPTTTPQPNYQPELQAPTQTPVYIISTRIVKETVEVPATVIVPQPVQVIVTPTPEPGADGQCSFMAVIMPLDDADKAAGVVQRGHMTECAVATARAAGVLP